MPRTLPNPPYRVVDTGYKTPCWLWLGTSRGGYGMIHNSDYKITGRKKMLQAHVVLYEKNVGPVPKGLVLDHLCNIRDCVNHEHMEPKTHAENIRRGRVPVINIEIANEIRQLHSVGNTQTLLAQKFNISQATVSQIIRKVTWL